MRYAVFIATPYTQQKYDKLYGWLHTQSVAGRTVFHPITTAAGCTMFAEPPESSLLLTEAH